jgi:hypothetical protein
MINCMRISNTHKNNANLNIKKNEMEPLKDELKKLLILWPYLL